MAPFLAPALALAFAAAAASADEPVPPALWANYGCAGGGVLQVAYFNVDPQTSLAAIAWAGKVVPMRAGPTGSGVRYIAYDEQESYRWHVKGDTGALLFQAADHDAEEQAILSECARIAG